MYKQLFNPWIAKCLQPTASFIRVQSLAVQPVTCGARICRWSRVLSHTKVPSNSSTPGHRSGRTSLGVALRWFALESALLVLLILSIIDMCFRDASLDLHLVGRMLSFCYSRCFFRCSGGDTDAEAEVRSPPRGLAWSELTTPALRVFALSGNIGNIRKSSMIGKESA